MTTYVVKNKHAGNSAASPREFLVRVTVSDEPALPDPEAQELRDVAWADFGRCLASRQLAALGNSMKCAVLCLFALFSIGCGARHQINPGADLAVYTGSVQWMHERKPGHKGNPSFYGGYYDPDDGSITVTERAHEWMLACIFTHELLGHAWDHQKPRDGWELLARYHSPAFPLLTHSQEQIEAGQKFLAQCPDPIAVQRALEAARLAQQQEAGQ